MRKLDEFAGHDLVEAMNARDAIAQRDDGADFVDLNLLFVAFDLLTKQLEADEITVEEFDAKVDALIRNDA